MKGQGAVIAVILIVVVIAVVFLIFSGSGFFPSGGIVYSNDVVSVADRYIADRAPYDGQKTTIEFTVRNQGKGTAKGIEVVLEPPTGFTSSVKCGDKSSCKFDLEEGDATDVVITLTAVEGVTQIIPVDVRYKVKYPYKGEREAHIPIVADKDELPKGQSFFLGDGTYGPLQVSIQTPDSRTTSDGGSAVYAVSGIPIKMDFSIQDAGGGWGGGTIKPVVMQGDDLKLTLTNFATIFCDKIDPKTNTLKVSAAQQGDESLFAKVGEEVPFDVTCTFDPMVSGTLSEGVIKFDYKYDYEISFIDQFTILPRDVPKIEGLPGGVGSGTSGGSEQSGAATSSSSQSAGSDTMKFAGVLDSRTPARYHPFEIFPGGKYTVSILSPTCSPGDDGPKLAVTVKVGGSNVYNAEQSATSCTTINYDAPAGTQVNDVRHLEVSTFGGWRGTYNVQIAKVSG